MKKNKLVVIYLVILAAQIIVSNTLGFEQYFLINVLPAMIMMLPTSVSTRKALFIAFLSGFAVDVTTEGVLGLNVLAIVPVAMLRFPILSLVSGSGFEDQSKEISLKAIGYTQMTIILLLTLNLFLLIYLWSDASGEMFSLRKLAFSIIAGYICSIGVCHLLAPVEHR